MEQIVSGALHVGRANGQQCKMENSVATSLNSAPPPAGHVAASPPTAAPLPDEVVVHQSAPTHTGAIARAEAGVHTDMHAGAHKVGKDPNIVESMETDATGELQHFASEHALANSEWVGADRMHLDKPSSRKLQVAVRVVMLFTGVWLLSRARENPPHQRYR